MSQLSRAALKLGLQLVQVKLGQALGAPGFSSSAPVENPLRSEQPQQRSIKATAHITSPKIVNTR